MCDVPVISNDLYPTILELTRLKSMPHQHVDGVSLVPLLEGGSIERSSIFWHYPHYNRHPSNAPVSIVRNGDWKLIEFLETSEVELYDLGKDLGEANNLADARPEVVKELLQELRVWKDEVRAEPMLPNPQFIGDN